MSSGINVLRSDGLSISTGFGTTNSHVFVYYLLVLNLLQVLGNPNFLFKNLRADSCCHLVKNYLSFRLLSVNVRIKI